MQNNSKSFMYYSALKEAEQLPTSFFLLLIYFIFKLYNIVFVVPNIEMNPPQVYMCSPS